MKSAFTYKALSGIAARGTNEIYTYVCSVLRLRRFVLSNFPRKTDLE